MLEAISFVILNYVAAIVMVVILFVIAIIVTR